MFSLHVLSTEKEMIGGSFETNPMNPRGSIYLLYSRRRGGTSSSLGNRIQFKEWDLALNLLKQAKTAKGGL
jgi:hypothetical protein